MTEYELIEQAVECIKFETVIPQSVRDELNDLGIKDIFETMEDPDVHCN